MRPRISRFLARLKWQDLLRFLLAAFLIGAVLMRTSFQEIADLRGRFSPFWLVLSFLLYASLTLIKTAQYWFLFDRHPSYRRTLRIVVIQNALANFVANSAGIASFLAMFQIEEKVKVRDSGGVFILTKAGDLFCMELLLLGSAILTWNRIEPLHELVIVLLTVVGAALLTFWTTVFLRRTVTVVLRRICMTLKIDHISLVANALTFLDTISALRLRAILIRLGLGLGLSLLYISVTALYGYSNVHTFSIPIDAGAVLFIVAVMQFISIIPIQVLGGLGVSEVSMLYLYGLFGFTEGIPTILVGMRALYYLFNLILLTYLPLDGFLSKRVSSSGELP